MEIPVKKYFPTEEEGTKILKNIREKEIRDR